MTFRRIIWIALIHFIVMVCFPYFGPGGGMTFAIFSFLGWTAAALAIGLIGTVLLLDRWDKFNALVTAILLIGALWTVLSFLPQENKVSPLKKITYGDFPSGKDMHNGLKNFGINLESIVDWVKGAKGTAEKLNEGNKRVQKAMEDLKE